MFKYLHSVRYSSCYKKLLFFHDNKEMPNFWQVPKKVLAEPFRNFFFLPKADDVDLSFQLWKLLYSLITSTQLIIQANKKCLINNKNICKLHKSIYFTSYYIYCAMSRARFWSLGKNYLLPIDRQGSIKNRAALAMISLEDANWSDDAIRTL